MLDLYDVLSVKKNATSDQIKRAYRTLSNKHHPDKGGDPEKFRELVTAYNILFDPEKRARYDNGESVEAINKSMADLQNEIMGNLTQMFIQVVSNVDENTHDIATAMKCMIDEGQRKLTGQIDLQQAIIRKFKNASKRIKSTKEDNVFVLVSNAQIAAAEAAIKNLERHVQIGKEMKTFLEAYSYEHDPLVQHYTFTINGMNIAR